MKEDTEREIFTYRLSRLKDALHALAMSPARQLTLFPDGSCKVDELAEEFNIWLQRDLEQQVPGPWNLLYAIDQRLSAMSGQANSYLWTEEALYERSEWTRIREMAQEALIAFGWENEPPPVRM